MRWITPEWVHRASDPATALPEARSVISCALGYRSGERADRSPARGLIARYAWGDDYHQVLGRMLERAAAMLRDQFGGEHRWFVDTGPAMDKALAARSGLGWYGKNTNILTESLGSYVLLGEIITTLDIEPDGPLRRDCGSCSLCVVACPTGALGPDYSIDSRRCISYLTIEHRGPIPTELRPLMGAWVFGCDICQDVCPPANEPYFRSAGERSAWKASLREVIRNRGATATTSRAETEVAPNGGTDSWQRSNPLAARRLRQDVDLLQLLRLTHEDYLEMFRSTSIRRAKVWMLRRNAAVALGNVGGPEAVIPLGEALFSDDNEIVRGHAAWALGRIGLRTGTPVAEPLSAALESEHDPAVQQEIHAALAPLRQDLPAY
jgi:epoxyqueuosine reductase